MTTEELSDVSSFSETADIETSNDDYATRFKGATGAWMLGVQTKLTRMLLSKCRVGTLLDVGGGHGQLAHPLSADGWKITVTGSDPSCEHRIKDLTDAGKCKFIVCDSLKLPFPDKSFDAVICFRLLTHCGQWELLVKELCRVSRGPVIVDYPTSQSVNAIAPALFAAKKKIERNTRTWRLFRHVEVTSAFAAAGWKVVEHRKQFALPMVLHRAVKCAALSGLMETMCRAVGLTALVGSPVIIRAEKN